MCALCGALRNEHWADTGSGRRSRVLRVALLDRVLAPFGLTVREWAGQLVLADRKGRTEVVEDLTGLWVAAERLTGSPLDPLDPRLIEAL
jgi:hypothetical protein